MGFVVFHNWNLPPILHKKVKMFQNEGFVITIKKTKTMVICRLILGIFGDFQNFQIFRFQIIWKFSGNCCIWQIARYWLFFPLNFGHWVWFFTQNSFSWNFQIPDSRKRLAAKNYYIRKLFFWYCPNSLLNHNIFRV